MENKLDECCMYPGANCDTDHQLLMATLKVRLAKRQRQHSIRVDKQHQLEGMCMELEAANS